MQCSDSRGVCPLCSMMWEKACELEGPESTGSVHNLIEGVEYQFRVVALNKAGQSEPSEPSKPIIAKARFREWERRVLRYLQRDCYLSVYYIIYFGSCMYNITINVKIKC